jgi:N-acetyltransferase
MIEQGVEGPLTATLRGDLVTLEPFAEEHRDGLWEAAQPDEIWAWLAHLNKSREFFDYWFDTTLASDATAEGAPGETGTFAVCRLADEAVVGTSRYLGVRRHDRVVEIGWTWFNPSVWRTGVNVETKLLMFTRAFETLGCDSAYYSVIDDEWPATRDALQSRLTSVSVGRKPDA